MLCVRSVFLGSVSYAAFRIARARDPACKMLLPRRAAQTVVLCALLNCLNFVLIMYGISVMDMHLLVILVNTTPLFAVLLSRVLLGERTTPVKAAAALLCLLGINLIMLPGFFAEQRRTRGEGASAGQRFGLAFAVGVLFLLICAFSRAFSSILLKSGGLTSESAEPLPQRDLSRCRGRGLRLAG